MKRKILIILSIFMAVVIAGCGDSGNSAGTNTGTGTGTGTGDDPFNGKCASTNGLVNGTYKSVLTDCFSDMLTTTPDTILNKEGQYQVITSISGLSKSVVIRFTVSDSDKTILKQSLVDYFGELTDMKAKYPDEPDFQPFDEVWQGSKANNYITYRIDTISSFTFATLTYEIAK